MFRTWDFAESPLAKEIFTPPKASVDYGKKYRYINLKDINPVPVGLPADAEDAIGIIIEKYSEDFKEFVKKHKEYYEELRKQHEFGDEINVLPVEDSNLCKSIVLRCALKVGFKITIKKMNSMSDNFHHVLKITEDVTWFIRKLTLLSTLVKDDNLRRVADLFREIIVNAISVLNSRHFWKRISEGGLRRMTFRPYPRWYDVTIKKASQWHVDKAVLCRIFIMCGLNTEVPLESYEKLLHNFIVTPDYLGSLLHINKRLPIIYTDFIKTTLKEYSNYILESINKKKLCNEVKNIILELLE